MTRSTILLFPALLSFTASAQSVFIPDEDLQVVLYDKCAACKPTTCGDGIVQSPNGSGIAEACDDGNVVNTDLCNACVKTKCGDGIISGLTMYGGLIVAGFMVIRYFRLHGLAVLPSMDSAAPGLMLAYAIGRIGCQVSGDGDWGIVNSAYLTNPNGTVAAATIDQVRSEIEGHAAFYAHHFGSTETVPMKAIHAPSFLPEWMVAYAYPHNVNGVGMELTGCQDTFWGDHCAVLPLPVFPTPLYEVLVCGLFAALLWAIRKRLRVPGMFFAAYLMLNGFERFWIEKIRVNEPFLGSITQAEVISTLLFLLGVAGFIWLKRRSSHGPEAAH